MLGFGRFGRARQKIRRLLAVVGVSLLLGYQAFSAVVVIHEADHHCHGKDCPICMQIHQCVANFILTGSGFEPVHTQPDQPKYAGDIIPAKLAETVHPTLVSLKVRMDE